MRTTTKLGLATAAGLLALTGCTSSGNPKPASATTPAAPTTSAAPTPDRAALIRACIDAINAGKDDGIPGAPECTSLSKADYYEAIHERNQAAIKKFQEDTDRAASATP